MKLIRFIWQAKVDAACKIFGFPETTGCDDDCGDCDACKAFSEVVRFLRQHPQPTSFIDLWEVEGAAEMFNMPEELVMAMRGCDDVAGSYCFATNARALCTVEGHWLHDCSSGGPDSGNMDHECTRCGEYWSCPLY